MKQRVCLVFQQWPIHVEAMDVAWSAPQGAYYDANGIYLTGNYKGSIGFGPTPMWFPINIFYIRIDNASFRVKCVMPV